jgi:hypothetical protein
MNTQERIADTVIYVFAIIPLLIVALSEFLCTGENFGVVNCLGGSLGNSFFNFFLGYGFLIVFGGFFLFVPVMLIASVVSIRSKLKRIKIGGISKKILWMSPTHIFFYLTFILIFLEA